MLPDDLTLVLDVGKSNAKLLLIGADGEVVARRSQANVGTQHRGAGPTYDALGVDTLQAWLFDAVPGLPGREQVRRISITTHGAAFCGVGDDGLALLPMDYEWDGYGELARRHAAEADAYALTGSPRLPQGLNAGLQLHWLQTHHPEACAQVRWWLPYPQYWAWWLTGVAATERSSLGCHTDLWRPAEDRPSDWARRRGLANAFPPLREAWAVLGTLRPSLARRFGLPADVEVHVGSHDSNACLARYRAAQPDATVVSSGTWCVLMAPGARWGQLEAARDELLNVSVDGRPVPTARFMGGREYAEISGGADPRWADEPALAEVLAQGWLALPAFAASGGPYAGRPPALLRHGRPAVGGLDGVPAPLRPALAALYCALLTDELVRRLDGAGPPRPVIVEGPFAGNVAWLRALQGLLTDRPLLRSDDELEGTARGAWLLTQPLDGAPARGPGRLRPLAPPADAALAPALDRALAASRRSWRAQLSGTPAADAERRRADS